MGVNNNNPCPICGSIYSEYAGAYLSTCRGCGNTFDAKAWTWEKIKPVTPKTEKEIVCPCCGERRSESGKELCSICATPELEYSTGMPLVKKAAIKVFDHLIEQTRNGEFDKKFESIVELEQQARDMKEVLEWILDGSNVYRHSKVRTKIKEVLK